MTQKLWKKTGAALMALTLIGGALPAGIGGLTPAGTAITASAADVPWYETSSGTLILAGVLENSGSNGVKLPDNLGVDRQYIKHVVAEEGTVLPANCEAFFQGMTQVETIDLSRADAGSVTSMFHMFKDLPNLRSVTFGTHFNTGSVSDMHEMFSNCSSLTALNLDGWDVRKVQFMNSMFYNCGKLKTISFKGWNTSSLSSIFGMFYSCESLEHLDLSSFNTSNVIDMADMFTGCSALTTVDLGSFDTSRVKNMSNMFYGCSNLVRVDLSSFHTANLKTTTEMFAYCTKLETIWVSENWYIPEGVDTSAMFNGCNVTAADAFMAPAIRDISVTLTDDLALNFYVKDVLSQEAADKYYAEFAGKCEEADGNTHGLTKKNGRFAASANVSADHMDEPITVYLYEKGSSEPRLVYCKTFSVNRYLNKAQPEEDWNNEQKAAFAKLIGTVRLYGETANAYFNTPDELPDVESRIHEILQDNDLAGTGESIGMEQAEISLVLNSRMKARIYPLDAPANLVGELGEKGSGSTIAAIPGKNGRQCFEFGGFSPLEMLDPMVVAYTGSTGEHTVRCTPLLWVRRVAEKCDTDAMPMKNRVMASILYDYYKDAVAFYKALNYIV